MNIRLVLLIGFLSIAGQAVAQDSLRVRPSPSLPHGQHGTPGDLKTEQKEDRMQVEHDKIPPRMKGILESDEKYLGWEAGPIFYESGSDQYLVHIVSENTTRTYRFDKTGEPIVTETPVTTDETRQ